MANDAEKRPFAPRGVAFPEPEPTWGYATPDEYLAAKAAEAEAAKAEEEASGEDGPPLKVEGIRLTADDGTQVIAVTRFERDEGSRKPGARAKRAYYWIKEKVLWLIGVILVSMAATVIWQSIS